MGEPAIPASVVIARILLFRPRSGAPVAPAGGPSGARRLRRRAPSEASPLTRTPGRNARPHSARGHSSPPVRGMRPPSSKKALRNLQKLEESALSGRYELVVIDVLAHPARAEEDRVLATPTLLRLSPGPRRRILGDLSDLDVLVRTIAGASPGRCLRRRRARRAHAARGHPPGRRPGGGRAARGGAAGGGRPAPARRDRLS